MTTPESKAADPGVSSGGVMTRTELWHKRQENSKAATAAHDRGDMAEYFRLNSEGLRLDALYDRLVENERTDRKERQ